MKQICAKTAGPAIRILLFAVFAVILYTGLVTLFGSHLPMQDGVVITCGQPADAPGLFRGRPARYTTVEKDGKTLLLAESAALDPESPDYQTAVLARKAALCAEDPAHRTDIPKDLWTASASGMDPDISAEGARWQIPRLMQETGLSEDQLETIIQKASSASFLTGIPTVNVQKANLLLQQAGQS